MVEFSKELKNKIRVGARRWMEEKLTSADARESFRASIADCTKRHSSSDPNVFFSRLTRLMPLLTDDEQDVLLAASQTDLRPFFSIAALAIAGDPQAEGAQP